MVPDSASDQWWIAIPNEEQLDRIKLLWLAVTWAQDPGLPPDPTAWAPQGFTITGGTDPVSMANGGYTYLWQWVIVPQPDSELIQFPSAFPWGAGVSGVAVASKCVPEPSTLVGLGSMGLWGLFLLRRRVR